MAEQSVATDNPYLSLDHSKGSKPFCFITKVYGHKSCTRVS